MPSFRPRTHGRIIEFSRLQRQIERERSDSEREESEQASKSSRDRETETNDREREREGYVDRQAEGKDGERGKCGLNAIYIIRARV